MSTFLHTSALTFLLFFTAVAVQPGNEKVKISLFYETYCPYSIQFVIEQLLPTTVNLPDYVELDLIPYGKATRTKVNGGWTFQCQHGPRECYGNQIHACVLEQAKVKLRKSLVEMLACLMQTKYEDEKVKTCCKKTRFNYERLKRCMIVSAPNLLAKYGQRTDNNNPRITFVPLLMFNDYFNQTLDEDGTSNLMHVVCILLKDTPPKQCQYFF